MANLFWLSLEIFIGGVVISVERALKVPERYQLMSIGLLGMLIVAITWFFSGEVADPWYWVETVTPLAIVALGGSLYVHSYNKTHRALGAIKGEVEQLRSDMRSLLSDGPRTQLAESGPVSASAVVAAPVLSLAEQSQSAESTHEHPKTAEGYRDFPILRVYPGVEGGGVDLDKAVHPARDIGLPGRYVELFADGADLNGIGDRYRVNDSSSTGTATRVMFIEPVPQGANYKVLRVRALPRS